MNQYESIIIVNPNLDEAGLKALEEKFTGLINENGKLESVENMGKKKLAYEIKKQKEGTYLLFNFEAKPDSIQELERVYRITDQYHRRYHEIYRSKKRRLRFRNTKF